ncbi:MAG: hypothetical protein IH886_08375, partial [Nitrospinae bacterium]|nr:hypothetical protein [Nitrospinota bacterium]
MIPFDDDKSEEWRIARNNWIESANKANLQNPDDDASREVVRRMKRGAVEAENVLDEFSETDEGYERKEGFIFAKVCEGYFAQHRPEAWAEMTMDLYHLATENENQGIFFGCGIFKSKEEWVNCAIEAGKLKFGESAVDEIERHARAAGELYDVMEHFYKTDKKYFLKETIVMNSLVGGLFNQHLP